MNSSSLRVTNHPFPASRLEWRLNQPFELSLRPDGWTSEVWSTREHRCRRCPELGELRVQQRLHAVLRAPSVAILLLYSKLGAKSRLQNYLKQVAGELGLMNLGTVRHGLLMSALNGPRHAQMFLIGNPLTAMSLMKVFKQAGVYAPLRIMFHDDGDDATVVTYDAPSKLRQAKCLKGKWRPSSAV